MSVLLAPVPIAIFFTRRAGLPVLHIDVHLPIHHHPLLQLSAITYHTHSGWASDLLLQRMTRLFTDCLLQQPLSVWVS